MHRDYDYPPSSLAVRNLIIDHTAATWPDMAELERGLLYPRRRPGPLNLNLCSSCEYGSHQLCPTRLGGRGWQSAFDCGCLCRYADQGLPPTRRKPAQT